MIRKQFTTLVLCIVLISICMFNVSLLSSEPYFTEYTILGLGSYLPLVSLIGDIDNDGDVDIITLNEYSISGGGSFNEVYKNNGKGNFTKTQDIGLDYGRESVSGYGSLGDLDNDGDLDVMMGAWQHGENRNVIYLNNSTGTFTEKGSIPDPNAEIGATWATDLGDIDNDGDLDLVIGTNTSPEFGITSEKPLKIFLNDGKANFSSHQNLGSFYIYDVEFIDFDKDSDLDLLVALDDKAYGSNVGNETGKPYLRIFYNQNGTFTTGSENIQNLEIGIKRMSVFNLNYDLYPDIILTRAHIIYDYSRNYPPGKGWNAYSSFALFNDSNINIDVEFNGYPNPTDYSEENISEWDFAYDVAIGDVDNSGSFDAAVANLGISVGTLNYNNVYLNIGSNPPTKITQGIGPHTTRSINLADFDNDGDLDIISGDRDWGNSYTGYINAYHRIYLSNIANTNGDNRPNTSPLPPSEENSGAPFLTEINSNEVWFYWPTGWDSESGYHLLTYDLRVGTAPGSNDIFSGVVPTGPGNIQPQVLPPVCTCPTPPQGFGQAIYKLKGLTPNTVQYYWSVRTVDSGFRRSIWSAEQTFGTDLTAPTKPTIRAGINFVKKCCVNGKAYIAADGIRISWDRNKEVDMSYYTVYRNESVIATVNHTSGYSTYSYIDRNVQYNKTYSYKITASDIHNNKSNYSNIVSITYSDPFVVYGGHPEPSPYLIQRKGYYQYGDNNEETVDYHPEQLIYQISKLDKNKKYCIAFNYNGGGNNDRIQTTSIDGIPVDPNYKVPEEFDFTTHIIPKGTYNKDSEIEITITKKEGPDVVIADIIIWEDEPGNSNNPNPIITKSIPKDFSLSQNYPNPFNPKTTIEYNLPKSEHIFLSIYNIQGQLVTTLVNEKKPAGYHSVHWNGIDNKNSPVSSGIYFYTIKTGNSFTQTRKMLLIK